jgi:hypothetical protein
MVQSAAGIKSPSALEEFVNALVRVVILLGIILTRWQQIHAQPTYFAGGAVGISTLSADAQTSITRDTTAISLYRPFNGPAVNVFAGIHLTEVFTLQANYVYNANDLTATSTQVAAGRENLFEERRESVQHAFIGDLLVYFRNRRSWARPYLSSGIGGVRFRSNAQNIVSVRGSPNVLPVEFTSTAPALRVAVGIDLTVHPAWAFRYSFSETIRSNPVSAQLVPAGERKLANFQNLFGFVRFF